MDSSASGLPPNPFHLPPRLPINSNRYHDPQPDLTDAFPYPASYIQGESDDNPRQRFAGSKAITLYLSIVFVNDEYPSKVFDLDDG